MAKDGSSSSVKNHVIVPVTKHFIKIIVRKKGSTFSLSFIDRFSCFASSMWCQRVLVRTVEAKLLRKAILANISDLVK